MSDYKLTYKKEKSQEIYIESVDNDNSYFKKEYDEAIIMIKDIIESQNKQPIDRTNGYGCNNRILFIGQRGCGKTSVMRSIANYLVINEVEPKTEDEKAKRIKFDCLPMVDPSHFDNNNNILLTVITSMFSVAKKKMFEAKDSEDISGKREELLKQFDNVFKSLESIKSDVQSYTLETLNRKSGAEDMRGKMNKLVQNYLDLLNEIRGGDSRYSKLVLMIDDIDMSVSYASEMLEQLRKYLELDNLIILMSANLNQLYNEMREHYSKAFQNTLNDQNQALSIDVEDLASKYLLKLFPTSRRVNVEHHVSQLLNTELTIKDGKVVDGKKEDRVGYLQKVILSLIWEKTRMLFVPKDPDTILHPIIPTNLRDLAQFLDMLTILPEVGYENDKLFKDEKAYDTCNKNLQVFKQYVMRTWIPSHLSVEEELVFENIPSDITEINKHLINSINVIGTKHKNRLMSREVSLDMIERNAENVNIDRDIYTMVSPNDPRFVKANKISDIFNQPSNYSYGDLLLMIDKYETYFESEDDRKFTDAIKIYYSILLFQTMFFDSTKVEYDFDNYLDLPKEQKIIPIQKLIGGTVYYPNYFEIITSKHFSQKGPSFDAKRAFYHKVEVKKKEKNDEKYDIGEKYPLFTVLYYGDIRPDRYDKKHIYDTTFEDDADVDGTKYVTFDILSILNNMLNPCHTMSRVGVENYSETSFSLKDWATYNQITDNERISLPNAVLPFYSVDMMLQYLKQSYSFDVIQHEFEGKKKNYHSDDITCLSKREWSELKKHMKDAAIDDYNVEKEEAMLKGVFDEEKQKDGDGNLEILKKAAEFHKKYSLGSDNDNELVNMSVSITEIYKNRVIALILSYFEGSKRSRDMLIKNIHKFDTPSEIYDHLVSVLYKDVMKENGVRQKVQVAVHSPEFVHLYYNQLWRGTERLLGGVSSDKDETIIRIYKTIYAKAIETFVINK